MFSSIKLALKAFGSFISFLNNKQLLDAGDAKANAKHSAKVIENVNTANKAVDGLASDDELKRVRDKHSRD